MLCSPGERYAYLMVPRAVFGFGGTAGPSVSAGALAKGCVSGRDLCPSGPGI